MVAARWFQAAREYLPALAQENPLPPVDINVAIANSLFANMTEAVSRLLQDCLCNVGCRKSTPAANLELTSLSRQDCKSLAQLVGCPSLAQHGILQWHSQYLLISAAFCVTRCMQVAAVILLCHAGWRSAVNVSARPRGPGQLQVQLLAGLHPRPSDRLAGDPLRALPAAQRRAGRWDLSCRGCHQPRALCNKADRSGSATMLQLAFR